jgi:DNA-directed RNA polymerase specialized sigma24 family protein
MLARALLNQDRLDDILAEDALIPHKESHAKVVFLPEALLDELSFVLPTAEVSAKRPQRKVCHRLRKLVRSLNGRERKAIRFLYFKGLSHQKVALKMKMNTEELNDMLNHAFATLRNGLGICSPLSP